MTVYLVHLDRPYGHAKHYTGSTDNLTARLDRHAKGSGARLLEVAAAAGIGWQLARTWEGGRERERQLKRQGGASRRCPLCGVRPAKPRPPASVISHPHTLPCAICEGPWPGKPVSDAELATWPEPPF